MSCAWLGEGSKLQRANEYDSGLARLGPIHVSDTEKFFPATLELRFNLQDIFRRDDENHSNAKVERLQQVIATDFSDGRKKAKDRWDRPRAKLNDSLRGAGHHAGQIAGDAATGDVRQRRDPTPSDNRF